MLVPLYAFRRGDTLGIVVLVQDGDTVEHLARNIEEAVAARIAPTKGPLVVHANGQRLDPGATIAEAGLKALDRVDVAPANAPRSER